MARRGFFAELNYQNQQAEKRRRQQHAAVVRAHNAAVREAQRVQREAERARAAAVRASDAQRKAAEKVAANLFVEARTAEVEAMNASLKADCNDIDTILEWTLGFDDYVDLESLKVEVKHPPFNPGALGYPSPEVPEPVPPPEPRYVEPEAPKSLSATFGGKKKHAAAVAQAQTFHQQALRAWQDLARSQHAGYLKRKAARERDEAERLEKLAAFQKAYEAECAQREADAVARNEELTKFINDLAFDIEYAIEDYVGIVLSNSVYPDAFPVDHEHTFDLATRELTLRVSVPEPTSMPVVKEYRYVKTKDEITSTQLSMKTQKDRYTSAVHQVAVRSLHEIFEADRAGKIHSIALTVGVERVSPATGQPEFVALIVVAADRETFDSFDLSNVVPSATLQHLGASMSKSPFDLTSADTSRGVRQRAKE